MVFNNQWPVDVDVAVDVAVVVAVVVAVAVAVDVVVAVDVDDCCQWVSVGVHKWDSAPHIAGHLYRFMEINH